MKKTQTIHVRTMYITHEPFKHTQNVHVMYIGHVVASSVRMIVVCIVFSRQESPSELF